MTRDHSRPFSDRLVSHIERRGPLCVGIDPYSEKIPEYFGPSGPGSTAIWAEAVIRRVGGKVAAVKLQAALFERWGAAGIAALEHSCRAAADAGLIVILDAKRGDIGATAQGYADAWLGPKAAAPCDAMTVNPYLGIEALEPFVRAAEDGGKGLAVLVRTSNAGAGDFQRRDMQGAPLFLRVAEAMEPLAARLAGRQSPWSGLMAVVGATCPEDARRIRRVLPTAMFLVPGFGAQGANAVDALSGFVSVDGQLQGGLVTASRSLTFPADARDGLAWERAIDSAVDSARLALEQASATHLRADNG